MGSCCPGFCPSYPEVGKKMLFLFDYGDEWRFKVELIGLGRERAEGRLPVAT